MTGYEPDRIRDYRVPISIHATGIAGLGLFDADFSSQNVYSGQLGEISFYKALCILGLIDRMTSYWSIAMPAPHAPVSIDPRFDSDIDCVIVQGEQLTLIDLKYYTSGDVTWFSEDGTSLLCLDNPTGRLVGGPRRMSRNMDMALSRFRSLFPRHHVSAFVVLIPTDAGVGMVRQGTHWPGGVPLVTLPDMLALLSQRQGFADAATGSALSGLLKGSTPAA